MLRKDGVWQDSGGTPTTTTRHEYRGYVFTLTYRAQLLVYTVDFPDFPDIITSGETFAEAFAQVIPGSAV